MDSNIRLAELVVPLSLATDIGTGEPMESSLCACLLALQLGDAVGLRAMELADLYYLTLLRAAGCTAATEISAAIFGDEDAFRAQTRLVDYGDSEEMLRALIQYIGAELPVQERAAALMNAVAIITRDGGEMFASHCEVAQMLAGRLGMNAEVQTALGQIHERWDGRGGPKGLKGESINPIMRIAQLAHHIIVFHSVGGIECAVTMTRKWSGSALDPTLVERFCEEAPRLCQVLETDSPSEAVLAIEPEPHSHVSSEQMEAAFKAVADFADLKTVYTLGHSSGVAHLASAAAEYLRLPLEDVIRVRYAGYLHDLGRVGISTAIWNKPGALSDSEWERVRLHPYFTERILTRSGPLSQLAGLAAAHHERLDGSGYHRGVVAQMLSPLMRILAAADVYHAMLEPRPHRPAPGRDEAAGTLRRLVQEGHLDPDAVDAVLTVAGHGVSLARRTRIAGLTDREVQVLRLLARGSSNREIAQRLTISPQTAGHHVRHIYDKINVSTRAAASLFAMQHNLLDER